MHSSRVLLDSVFACAVLLHPVVAKTYQLDVPATDVARAGQMIAFALPADAPKDAILRDRTGRAVALQADADGMGRFVVPLQQVGEALSFTLVEGKAPPTGAVKVATEPGRLRVDVGGAPAFFYRMDKEQLPRADIKPEFKRAGYLHPVFTPSGKLVTDDYPSNHVHHHGIWSAWTKTKFQGRTPDFWNMGTKTGTVEFVGLDRTWSGAVHGGFTARQQMVDLSAPSPIAALNETWQITAYQVGGATPALIIDLVITQTCATGDPLLLPNYHYGGLGYRGRDEWNGKTNLTVLTSEGETNRDKANATRMRWCHLGGAVENGGVAGVAVLDHPENFRAPQPVRVHPNMPYLSFTPSQLGDWSIEPGKPYVARYRFVVADGAADRQTLDAYWNGYARPAVATLAAPDSSPQSP